MSEFVTLRSFFTPHEAHIAQNSLKAAGIESVILNELSTQVYNFHAPSDGGVILKVQVDNVELAQEILAEDFDKLLIDEEYNVNEASGIEPNEQEAPPKIQFNKLVLFLILVGLVLLLWKIIS